MFYRYLFLMLFTCLFAEGVSAQITKDPKAKEILNGVSDQYKTYKSVTADFKIIIEDLKAKSKETQQGTISIKGNMYKLTLSDQEVISDGKTIWTYLKESNEVQMNEPGSKTGAITPDKLFTIYETGFGSRYMGERNIDGKIYQLIELVPEDAKKSFFKIQLQLNKSEKQVSSAKIFQKNGTYITYSIDKFRLNNITNDSLFTFRKEKHPGVEVIDLR